MKYPTVKPAEYRERSALMVQQPSMKGDAHAEGPCSGFCLRCGRQHSFGEGQARRYGLALMEELTAKERIDLLTADEEADPRFSSDYLFGKARGQMFGVLVYREANGAVGSLRAFSGQYNSVWEVDGWAPEQFANALRHDQSRPEFNPHFRQLLHVGYKVAAKMGDRYLNMLVACEESISRNVTENLYVRHIQPLFLED